LNTNRRKTVAAVNLRALFSKLNMTLQQTLSGAVGLCRSRRNDYVEIEHWLAKLLEVGNTDLTRLFRHYDVDVAVVGKQLTTALDKLRRGSDAKPGWALAIEDGIREAWILSTLEYNTFLIRSGFLLTAILTDRNLSQKVTGNVPELGKIPADRLIKEVREIIAGSVEDDFEAAAPQPGPGGEAPVGIGSKTPSLDQFTHNLTAKAKKGEIDPVIGRDFEIRQIIDILTRRRQNNPILTGEAGVGKTAVVEGFALRINAGDVPGPLKNAVVHVLDLGLLQAGAGVKGEFEQRLKGVLGEVKASPHPIILFIDEAHTMIGAGGSAGQGDAANLLKPALARGELRTIAATTWMEYKKYFEEDPALKRRFQVVKVEEPSVDLGVHMLRGLTATLEKHHKVAILDEAVDDAVKLSHRYLTERQLPDKAISVLDTSCAKVALSQSTTPPALEDSTRELELLDVEIGILEREQTAGMDHKVRLEELQVQKTAAEERKKQFETQMAEERKIVEQISQLREQLLQKTKEDPKSDNAKLLEQLNGLKKQLAQVQGETPLVHPMVDRQAVAEVISGWTGIPIGKMVLDEINTVMTLQDRLRERVIGQDTALEVISERMRTARANLLDPKRPLGVFLLVGPSGVGKTETALALADILYGGTRNLVVINMSEYKEDHKVSRLTGSAPGYVGYGQGGVLTEAIRRKPYSVLLLDEIEKANESVQEIFYQVFDKGTLQDDRGTEVNFKNTIIFLTSNVGTETIMKACVDPDTTPSAQVLGEQLRPDLLKSFKPALLGRMSVVPYFQLSDEVIRKIVKLQLSRVGERVQLNHRAQFSYADEVIEAIASRCKDVESGARNVDQIITGTLLPELAQEFLSRMSQGQTVQSVRIEIGEGGDFEYKFV
jgi:type VI secretion system protein VasG